MSFESIEEQFQREFPVLEQSESWKNGMRYRYSPDEYPLTSAQFEAMRSCGELMGGYLGQKMSTDRLIEFRMDFVLDSQKNLFVTEAQTDDRGIPAVALARNAKGIVQSNKLPGVPKLFMNGIKRITEKDDPQLLIVYPDSEFFYYAGFYDFAKLCWTEEPKSAVVVCQNSALKDNPPGCVSVQGNEANPMIIKPDVVWDFTNTLDFPQSKIQPFISKQPLLDIWSDDGFTALALREFVPQTGPARQTEVLGSKDDWILKPLSGRWSKGIMIGRDVSDSDWTSKISQEDDLLAQRFIIPEPEQFTFRDKKGRYKQGDFYSRIEGYYCKSEMGWDLADVLVTCTADLPVHGKRDCIMIPARVI